jgi:hypothetical protein
VAIVFESPIRGASGRCVGGAGVVTGEGGEPAAGAVTEEIPESSPSFFFLGTQTISLNFVRYIWTGLTRHICFLGRGSLQISNRWLLGLRTPAKTFMAQLLTNQTNTKAVSLQMIFEPTMEATANEFKRDVLGRDKR